MASINVRYKGLTNSYCRLVTLPANLQTAELVPLPPSANSEDCTAISDLLYFDVNGEGIPDVIQGLRVKSNRYDAKMSVVAVYLSSAGSKSGYCYSEQASRLVSGAALRSNAEAQRAIENERRRLAISLFECSKLSM